MLYVVQLTVLVIFLFQAISLLLFVSLDNCVKTEEIRTLLLIYYVVATCCHGNAS